MIDTKNSINNIKDKISANRIVERLRFAGTKIHVGFFDMDIFEKNLFFSKETYRILGYDLEEELSNKHIILEHIHPKEVSRYKKAIENLKENNKEIEKKFKFINKKTKEIIVCLLSLSIFYDEKNPRIIGTIKDITELENFHKNLKKDKKK